MKKSVKEKIICGSMAVLGIGLVTVGILSNKDKQKFDNLCGQIESNICKQNSIDYFVMQKFYVDNKDKDYKAYILGIASKNKILTFEEITYQISEETYSLAKSSCNFTVNFDDNKEIKNCTVKFVDSKSAINVLEHLEEETNCSAIKLRTIDTASSTLTSADEMTL